MDADQHCLKVFLCHAKEDKLKVRRLYQRLCADGIDAWLDEKNLLPGQDWRVEIPKAVREADVFMVCMSSVSARKEGFVQAEINFALDKALEKPEGAIYIIPAKLEECVVPDKLSRWQWVNLFDKDGYEKLLDALNLRANEIGAIVPRVLVSGNLETVQLILDGNFSEFNENRQDDLVGILATLLHVDKSSIRVLRTYPGSVIMEIELTKIGANRLLEYFEKGDFRLKNLRIVSVKFLEIEKKTRTRIAKSHKTSNEPQFSEVSKVKGGDQTIVVVGDVIGSNLVSGNENRVEISGRSVSSSETEMAISMRSERLVSDRVLGSWLDGHGMVANPFGSVDIKTHPIYPVGAARPDQWEAFLDPAPLFAHCLVAEDAQALSYLLQKECLPLGTDGLINGVNRCIFPIRVLHQQTAQIQSPLTTLIHSAAQAWLDILSSKPDALLNLSLAKQNALLELLCWSMGSNKAITDVLHANRLEKNETARVLNQKVIGFKSEFVAIDAPHQAILFSWLKISPFEMKQTYLILFGDNLLLATPAWWFEQFNSLVSALSLNGIVTKVIASTPLPTLSSLQDIKLSWSDIRLKQSIDSQFDAAIDPEEKLMGKAIRFHELFGPGATEEETTQRLISASNHSLARMLTLGNRLLQEHCNKAVIEKYLSIDELEDILKTA